MTPVLIFTDTRRINREKNFLNSIVPFFQSVCDAIAALNVTPTLTDINNLISWTRRNGAPNFVENFIVNKQLDKTGPVSFGGVTLNREKVRELMDIPDTSALTNVLKPSDRLFNDSGINGVQTNLLQLTDGVISKVSNADTQIETLYTYYTRSDASAALANDLQAVCDAMNIFDSAHGDLMADNINSDNTEDIAETPIKGIGLLEGNFVISLSFIRGFEETGSLRGR